MATELKQTMRLDRFLCLTVGLTRAQAKQVLRAGRVFCNGQKLKSASYHVQSDDQVTLDEQLLIPPGHRYLMLNKPQGYVCATEDSEHPTVIDLIPEEFQLGLLGQLHPAGRLDLDTTGLVLLSDDGQWTHRVISPNRQCSKVYQLRLADEVEHQAELIELMHQGLLLKGEEKLTLPAKLSFQNPVEATLEINEGRYHQVKRMFAAVGNRVVSLHRRAIGTVELDAELAPGECRELNKVEINGFMTDSSHVG